MHTTAGAITISFPLLLKSYFLFLMAIVIEIISLSLHIIGFAIDLMNSSITSSFAHLTDSKAYPNGFSRSLSMVVNATRNANPLPQYPEDNLR